MRKGAWERQRELEKGNGSFGREEKRIVNETELEKCRNGDEWRDGEEERGLGIAYTKYGGYTPLAVPVRTLRSSATFQLVR